MFVIIVFMFFMCMVCFIIIWLKVLLWICLELVLGISFCLWLIGWVCCFLWWVWWRLLMIIVGISFFGICCSILWVIMLFIMIFIIRVGVLSLIFFSFFLLFGIGGWGLSGRGMCSLSMKGWGWMWWLRMRRRGWWWGRKGMEVWWWMGRWRLSEDIGFDKYDIWDC